MSAYSTTQKQRLESLRYFRESASGANVKDDAQFRAVLVDAQTVLEMSDQQIADQLSVSRPTVNRWKNGKNLPHPAMRKHILNWIVEQAASRIKLVDQVRPAPSYTFSSAGYGLPLAAKGR